MSVVERLFPAIGGYCSLAYSALACFSTGMSGSASFQSLFAWNEGVLHDAATNDQEPLREKRGPDFVRTERMNCTGGFAVDDDTVLRLFALNKLLLNIVIIR